MSHEDKLTKYERLRLEAFAQACGSSFAISHERNKPPTLDQLFDQALKIETFLKSANPN